MTDWRDMLSAADRATIDKGRFAQRAGFGRMPALIVIDAQNYMVGRPERQDDYPLSCGDSAWPAVSEIRRLASSCRAVGVPVIYTQFVLARDGSDAGMFDRKIGVGRGDNAYFAGTHGAEIVPDVAPQPGDLVFIKKKPSAFFGTALQSILVDRQIDTLIIAGGATCNCVRATASDSFSLNYRTIVPREAVFDRIAISHEITLFDIDRFLGDVVSTDETIAFLESLPRRND